MVIICIKGDLESVQSIYLAGLQKACLLQRFYVLGEEVKTFMEICMNNFVGKIYSYIIETESYIILRGKCIKEQTEKVEKEMATYSSILAQKILWTEDAGGLQRTSMGSQKSWRC